MGPTNWARVLFGGFVAGMVADAGEYFLHTIILQKAWTDLLAKLGPPAGPAAGTLSLTKFAGYAIASLVLGVCVVWIYSAIRPRFRSNARAVLAAATVIWIPGFLLAQVVLLASGVLPAAITLPATGVGFVELVAGAAAGALVYGSVPAATAGGQHA